MWQAAWSNAHLNRLPIHGCEDVTWSHAFAIYHVLTGCNDEVYLRPQLSQVLSQVLRKVKQKQPRERQDGLPAA